MIIVKLFKANSIIMIKVYLNGSGSWEVKKMPKKGRKNVLKKYF